MQFRRHSQPPDRRNVVSCAMEEAETDGEELVFMRVA